MPKTLKRVGTLNFLKQMKKKVEVVALVSVIVGLTLVGVATKMNRKMVANDILLGNVEALAEEGDEGSKPKTCGTKEKRYDSYIVCPVCKAKTGFFGTVYSYASHGDDETYLEGKCGTEVRCTPRHDTVKEYNDVVEKKCE